MPVEEVRVTELPSQKVNEPDALTVTTGAGTTFTTILLDVSEQPKAVNAITLYVPDVFAV